MKSSNSIGVDTDAQTCRRTRDKPLVDNNVLKAAFDTMRFEWGMRADERKAVWMYQLRVRNMCCEVD